MLAWLARHPRWTFHFTPTSGSWLNAVENFFSKMTRQRIRRGVFRSIADLQAAINAISPSTMPAPNPSSGPNPPTLSSPNSTAALYHPFKSVHYLFCRRFQCLPLHSGWGPDWVLKTIMPRWRFRTFELSMVHPGNRHPLMPHILRSPVLGENALRSLRTAIGRLPSAPLTGHWSGREGHWRSIGEPSGAALLWSYRSSWGMKVIGRG